MLEEDAERRARRRRGHPFEPALVEDRDRGRQPVADAVDCQHGAGREAARARRRSRVRGVVIDETEIRARQTVARERTAKRRSAQGLERASRLPFGEPVFHAARQRRERAGQRVAAADRVVPLLAAGPPPRQCLGRIERRHGDDVDCTGRQTRPIDAGVNRLRGEPDLELPPRQPLFVDGKAEATVLKQRGA